MNRREVLSVLLAAPVASLAGAEKENRARVFRQDSTGHDWHEIGLMDPRPGDTILALGLDGSRLWRLHLYKVGPQGAMMLEGEPAVNTDAMRDLLKVKPEVGE